MRGLDGNYINTQGDSTARIQLVMQAEQDRQQLRARQEENEALRKLRESVNETEKKAGSGGPLKVGEEEGSGKGPGQRDREPADHPGSGEAGTDATEGEGPMPGPPAHIDIRV